MPINYQFTMALKALREVQAELGEDTVQAETLFPSVPDVLAEIGPLPPESLLFGVAADGLPLLLNLRDPGTGPLLILADERSGKTPFLHFLAQAAIRLLPSDLVRYAVITEFPDEWRVFESTRHCLDIIQADDHAALELLYDLACQTESGNADSAVLLLFDGLDSALHFDPSGQSNLRYLLESGPRAGVWPIVTANAARATRMRAGLELFHTRIYGRIADPGLAAELTQLPGAGLNTLFPGAQFCLRQKTHWLRFWLPTL